MDNLTTALSSVTALQWAVVVVGTLASLVGGYFLARRLPQIFIPGLLGEMLGVLSVVYLIMGGVPVIPAVLPVLIGSMGTVAGVLTRPRP